MTTPDDVKARVSSAYHSAADYYDHAGNSFWDRFGRRTIERVGLRPGSRVLDLCCGSGASALPAAGAAGPGGFVLGVDLAPGLLDLARAKARRLGLANVEFRNADILALHDAKEAFDAVVCVFGIFFVPDLAQALRTMWSYARPGGRVAVTTWGTGVFEPVNSSFWEAVRRVRPELFKSFNSWDRLGEPKLLERLFDEAGLPSPEIVLEEGSHPVPTDDDVLALILGTGYRGVVDQLSASEWDRVREDVLGPVRSAAAKTVQTDVIYATIRK